MATTNRIEIRPQPGPQETALSSPADVVIMGGAKGGGKSWAMRIFPLRYVAVRGFHAVIFRRTLIQVQASGGQWDSSYSLYPHFGGKDNKARLRWTFPQGSTITFSYLKQEKDWLNWQGTEVALYCFDQLEEFTQEQFLKILGCMRTTTGIPTQLIGTCNPDYDSWLRNFVEPWLADDGYVDLSQNGQIKHFTVKDGQIVWVDASWRDPNNLPPKSAVYINADVYDNKILLEQDPNYLANLQAQSEVDRERFLGIRGRGGNWNARAVAGKVFKFEWFHTLADRPSSVTSLLRFWDFASSDKEQAGDDPDRTANVLMGVLEFSDGKPRKVIILDVFCDYLSPGQIDQKLQETANRDGRNVKQRWFRDPGQAGVYQDQRLRSLLTGYDAGGVLSQISKSERSGPLSKACEYGEVYLLEAHWNYDFCNELVGFPDAKHDDQCLPGCTRIATIDGWKPIRSVQVGEKVLTRVGYRSVIWSGATGVSSRMVRLKVFDKELFCTVEHPIWTWENGFIPAKELKTYHHLLLCPDQMLQKPLSMMASPLGATPIQQSGLIRSTIRLIENGMNHPSTSIGTFGKSIMGQYRQVFTSTTKTKIPLTTTSQILNASHQRTICGSTRTPGLALKTISGTLIPSDHSLQTGIGLKSGVNGIRSMDGEPWHLGKGTLVVARSVVESFSLLSKGPNTVQAPAMRKPETQAVARAMSGNAPSAVSCTREESVKNFVVAPVQSVSTIDRKETVHNLTVEDIPEFFAEGILVHNCDAAAGAYNELTGAGALVWGEGTYQ